MKSESELYLDLLQRRVALLDSLAKALAEARSDFITLDIEAVRDGIQQQEQFCAQIRALDSQISSAQLRVAKFVGAPPRTGEIFWPESAGPDDGVGEQIRGTMRRIATAQTELKRLNDAHQAMLRRSRRSVNMLLNLLHSHAPTYTAQLAPEKGMLCEERV